MNQHGWLDPMTSDRERLYDAAGCRAEAFSPQALFCNSTQIAAGISSYCSTILWGLVCLLRYANVHAFSTQRLCESDLQRDVAQRTVSGSCNPQQRMLASSVATSIEMVYYMSMVARWLGIRTMLDYMGHGGGKEGSSVVS